MIIFAESVGRNDGISTAVRDVHRTVVVDGSDNDRARTLKDVSWVLSTLERPLQIRHAPGETTANPLREALCVLRRARLCEPDTGESEVEQKTSYLFRLWFLIHSNFT